MVDAYLFVSGDGQKLNNALESVPRTLKQYLYQCIFTWNFMN